MASKIVITVQEVEPGVYQISAEDDVAVAKYTTSTPRTVVQDIFKEFGIIGRMGRPRGSKNKAKVVQDGAEELQNFSPSTV